MQIWLDALSILLFATLTAGGIEEKTQLITARDGGDGDAFTSFVTRPEIKAPLFDVTNLRPESVTPGYWFVAPYLFLVSQTEDIHRVPCTIGPMIYDNAGELIWCGACLVNNTNTFDFRAWESEDRQYLSAILDTQSKTGIEHSRAIILNSSLQINSSYQIAPELKDAVLNMHEFNPVNDGKSALHIIQRSIEKDVTTVKHDTGEKIGRIVDNGFAEIDLSTRKVLFEWWASDHIALSDSSGVVAGLSQKPPRGWNWIHLNSVDKDANGDYLISARYTNAIYKISGKTGKLIWTLGGTSSSFDLMPGLNFSRQHDARFVSRANDVEVISFLDNGGDDHNSTASVSSGVVLALNTATKPMTAAAVKRWNRPSEGISKQRGNFQRLPNGNVFIGWSDKSHISEHNAAGELLLEAKWKKETSNTYRAWKFNFTSDPLEEPVLNVAIERRDNWPAPKTVFHVSWNGATEVVAWNSRRSTTTNAVLGTRRKIGFETRFEIVGCEDGVYAEAVSKNGKVLRTTTVQTPLDPDKVCSSKDKKQQLLPEEITPQPSSRYALVSFEHTYANYLFRASSVLVSVWLFWTTVRFVRRRWR
ncbi:hypothetical protein HII31_05760 [Pseudocercospora fuligena]|uniref:ASST-domain-containing protein n=1 Tax=Pseudocercospora fuligena TaxID=685502 RepID=A0A8H6RKZ6_9PEZI|nr:hypothetical protein HII31_05760 [Pseudocercospora fuligena]